MDGKAGRWMFGAGRSRVAEGGGGLGCGGRDWISERDATGGWTRTALDVR